MRRAAILAVAALGLGLAGRTQTANAQGYPFSPAYPYSPGYPYGYGYNTFSNYGRAWGFAGWNAGPNIYVRQFGHSNGYHTRVRVVERYSGPACQDPWGW